MTEKEDESMQKRMYAGLDTTDGAGFGPTEVMLVEAKRVRSVRERAAKLRANWAGAS